MTSKLSDLNERRQVQEERHDRAGIARNQEAAHLKDGIALRRETARLQAGLRLQDRRLRALEAQEAHYMEKHAGLTAKLHALMDPRILSIEERLRRRSEALAKAEEGLRAWDAARKKYKEAALMTLEERQRTLEMYRQAEAMVVKAREELEKAKGQYQDSRRGASQRVGQYRRVEAGYRAVLSRERAAARGVEEQRGSLARLRRVLQAEERNIEQSLLLGRQRLQKRLREAQKVREQMADRLTEAQARYQDWAGEQRARAQDAAKQRAEYAEAAEALEGERKDVLGRAEAAAGERVVSDSPWAGDDWAWTGEGEGGA